MSEVNDIPPTEDELSINVVVPGNMEISEIPEENVIKSPETKTEETGKEASDDNQCDEFEFVNEEECNSIESVESQKREGVNSPKSLLESFDLDLPSSYEVEPGSPSFGKANMEFLAQIKSHSLLNFNGKVKNHVAQTPKIDFPKSPWFSVTKDSVTNTLSDEEEDKSIFLAQMLSNCQDVHLLKGDSGNLIGKKKKIIPVGNDIFTDSCCDESSYDGSHTTLDEHDLDSFLDSPNELDDSIMERLGREDVEPLPELTAAEENLESRTWKSCIIAGIERKIDLKVLEPYKKVVSHGGYLSQESHKAIIIFSACYLPDRSRVDYDYVMNNLFMYVITTLDQLVTDDYILIYLHGATSRHCMPKFKWINQCYQMIDRKLRKNLKGLYLVHPTFWLKTLVLMTKPFISSKFSKKIFFIYSLKELFRIIPLESTIIPERVKKYDETKSACQS